MPENGPAVQTTSGRAATRPASAGRRPPPEPEAIALTVLYQDEWLMAVDKPPGMVVHPTYRNWSGTLLNALLWHLRHAQRGEPRIVTRLDKDTSGLVLVALTSDVHKRIQRDTFERHVRKEYLAIVDGTPAPARGSIEAPLARSAADRRLVVVDPAGQRSQTDYEVLAVANGRALVRCELVTGRTHQIRVHLASCGWPILGDRVYGTLDPRLARQALHAWRISLPHPISRQRLDLEAALPADLRALADPGGKADADPAR